MSAFDNVEFIKASAGSGKTFRLMERVEEIVIDEKIPITSIMATTFTVKAANELKSRIRRKLIEANRIEEAQQVEESFIGTVDSVCGRILSDYAIDVGESPSMTVLPEENVDEFFFRALRETISVHQEVIVPLGERLGFDTGGWMSVLRDLIDGARSNALGAEDLEKSKVRSIDVAKRIYDGADTSLTLESVKQDLAPHLEEIKEVVQAFDKDPTAAAGRFGKGLCVFCTAAAEYEGAAWKELLRLSKAKPSARKTERPQLRQAMETYWKSLGTRLLHSSALQQDVVAYITELFELAKEGLEKFQAYKREFGLVDFVDQETKVLELLNSQKGTELRKAIKERVKVVMVDEFQDTSPLQLAIFLKLNEIVGRSVWVGDPKQSIYAFRGADPSFMGEILKGVEAADQARVAKGERSLVSSLPFSWRSKRNLIEFSNEVFARTFPGIQRADVHLELAPSEEQKPERQGGRICVWEKQGDHHYSGDALFADLAVRVKRLFAGAAPRLGKFRDLAILLRTNKECFKMSSALQREGLPVSVGGGELKKDPIAYLGMCAYRVAFSLKDTAAAEILRRYVPGVDLEAFDDAEQNMTPLEMLERAIVAFGVEDYVRSGLNREQGLATLEALRDLCREYMSDCGLRGVPATQSGFIQYFAEAEKEGASAAGGDCIQVMTYHKAKGLEWPVVVLGSLDELPKGSPFGARVIQCGTFDATNPLTSRTLQYVPAPFAAKHKDETGPFEDQNIAAFDGLHRDVLATEMEEARRLMYVGVTRARDEVIFFAKKQTKNDNPEGEPKIGWLEALSAPSLFMQGFLSPAGNAKWKIGDCPREFDVEMELLPDRQESDEVVTPSGLVDEIPERIVGYPPARIAPSSLEGGDSAGVREREMKLPARMSLIRESYSSDLGECFHSYMVVAVPGTDDKSLACGLIERWGVANVLSADELVAAGKRLRDWISQALSPKAIHTEIPMHFKHPNGQVSDGFIDVLVERKDGSFVIIDHKVVSNQSAETCVKTYAAQQEVYRNAVRTACGAACQVCLHLPVQGKLVEVLFADELEG